MLPPDAMHSAAAAFHMGSQSAQTPPPPPSLGSTPLWGEKPAGYEWQVELAKTLGEMGWRESEVPAMWYYGDGGPNDARMLVVVDDLLFSEKEGYEIANATVAYLRAKYGKVTSEREPSSFVGYKLERDRAARTLTISMPQKVTEAAREHLPSLLEGKADVLSGKKLMDTADRLKLAPRTSTGKLTPHQVRTQQLIGSLKFIERVQPKISLGLHRLSCVMSSPPPEAWDVACSMLAVAYADRSVGITYGGAGPDDEAARFEGRMQAHIDLTQSAGAQLEAAADATWCERNLYALILTYACGAVFHCAPSRRPSPQPRRARA